ncbi:MAG: lmo0937 family membrane protein, partial [Desulfobacterales bacterium]|nr:lmo0937 family membrane protein [Desulfobacterales bacterium]
PAEPGQYRRTHRELIPGRPGEGRHAMLWTIIVVLFILWLLGFTLEIGGGLVHILLVVALVVFIYNMVTGRRSRT